MDIEEYFPLINGKLRENYSNICRRGEQTSLGVMKVAKTSDNSIIAYQIEKVGYPGDPTVNLASLNSLNFHLRHTLLGAILNR